MADDGSEEEDYMSDALLANWLVRIINNYIIYYNNKLSISGVSGQTLGGGGGCQWLFTTDPSLWPFLL